MPVPGRLPAERAPGAGPFCGPRVWEERFPPLVRAHATRVIRLAYHFLGDWEEARDLAQETFARAFLCLDRYDPDRPFGAWLFTIAARLATDKLRRRRVQARARES